MCTHLLYLAMSCLFHTEHNYNQKKNETVLFAGVIDAQSYLLDVNDEGSFRSARGTQYLAACTEEGIKVCTESCDCQLMIICKSRDYQLMMACKSCDYQLMITCKSIM